MPQRSFIEADYFDSVCFKYFIFHFITCRSNQTFCSAELENKQFSYQTFLVPQDDFKKVRSE